MGQTFSIRYIQRIMGLFAIFRRKRRHSKKALSLYMSNSEMEIKEEDGNSHLLLMLSQQSILGDEDETYLPTIRVANTDTTNSSSRTLNVNQYTDRSTTSTVIIQPSLSRRNSIMSHRAKSSSFSLYATIEDLPFLIHEIQTAPTITCDQAGQTLRRLFALSEYNSSTASGSNNSANVQSLEETRKHMLAEGSLVTSLFNFLIRCYKEEKAPRSLISSVEMKLDGRAVSKTMVHPATMYLALLVLNNICIPTENKHFVAIHCHGLPILCHLLCYDPSCRMIAIVLVNLTFGTNTQFHQDLLFHWSSVNSKYQDTELFSSLAYALRVASLTSEEYVIRQRVFTSVTLKDLEGGMDRYNVNVKSKRQDQLDALLAFDQYNTMSSPWPNTSHQMFPDTARWCICALHHLTRPIVHQANKKGNDASLSAAMALIRTGIVAHLLRCIRVVARIHTPDRDRRMKSFSSTIACNGPSMNREISDTDTSRSQANTMNILVSNDPSKWVKETAQDAALFVIMNIAVDPHGRKYLLGHDMDTVSLLATICDLSLASASNATTKTRDRFAESIQIGRFQCIKARMTLACLVGSEGHYGQVKGRVGKWVYEMINKGRVLMMKDPFEVELLVDILAHSLYRRSKAGSGGYSGTTFRVKYVVWAIRCLLTQACNQEMFAGTDMEVLNSLLIKILAMRAVERKSHIDAEAAEHACFSLYLLSHFGFHMCFLPCTLGKDYNVQNIVTKVLIALQSMPDTTVATHYASRQILFRLRYLLCIDTTASLTAAERWSKWDRDEENDLCVLDRQLVGTIRDMLVPDKVRSGAQPRPDIFNRPLVACRRVPTDAAKKGASSYFSCALRAAYDLSFASTKVQHLNEAMIDDIAIANNIANCADGKVGVESYGYIWSWDEEEDELNVVSPTDSHITRVLSSRCHPTFSWQWLLTQSWCGGNEDRGTVDANSLE